MTQFRPPYAHAAGASAGAFLLYALTLAPTTWFWDTSEYIATAHILGIPHPPGNPLFVVVGRVWNLLLAPTGLDVPVRINLLAAFTSALATGFFFLVTYRILRGWLGAGEEGSWTFRMPFVGAWAGALMGATAFTVWNQSNVNEKVYTLSVLGIAAVSWLAMRWYDRRDEPGSGWLLVLAVYLMVLGSTNHLMALLPAPALGLLVLSAKPRVLLDRNLLVRGVLAAVVALSFNFFLPIRSAQQPIINEGEPVCETLTGAATAIYSMGRIGCPALAANLTREQYAKPPLNERQAPLGHQLLNYFQYFDWQWARGLAASEVPGNARLPVSLLFLGLGIWGIVVSVRVGRGPGLYVGTLALTLTIALVYYLNFRHGYSLAAPELPREVRERDYFFIASFHLWGFLAGMGLVALWRWASGGGLAGGPGAGGDRDGVPWEPPARNAWTASPVLLLALVPLIFNWGWATRAGDHSARDWAYNMLQSVEPYGIIFTNGDNDTFPLWYLQEVEGIRQDVTVIVVQYLYTDWYPRQLAHHTSPERQRPFRSEDDVGVYQVPDAPPSRPITLLSHEEMNQVPSGVLQQAHTVELGEIAVEYPPGMWLGRGERLALAIIRDSLGHRPIHFASTGGLPQEIGLDRWIVRQGLGARLHVGDLEGLPGVVRTSPELGGGWIDLEVSRTLAEGVFTYRGLEDRDIWADRATLNIPWHFYFLFMQLADAVAYMGENEDTVREYLDRADRFMITARGGHRGTP
jgi:hypothetical protein